MKYLLVILLFCISKNTLSQLAAHAGGTTTQGDSLSITLLNGSATGGTPPYTYAWSVVSKPNGNGWCANILNPTSAATEVLFTGVFSSPFGTAYKYRLQVTDATSATAADTATVNVTYSTSAPPQATGVGFHYVTSADSIADAFHQMSPSRHDVWIDGASTNRYAAGGTLNSNFDIRNAFAVYPNARVFISAGKYFGNTLYISKDSIFATKSNPWYLVPYGGQVEMFNEFVMGGCWKYFVITGKYDTTLKIGSASYQGHKKNYSFSSGSYGFYFNNGYKNIDAAGLNFGGVDSVHDGVVSFIEAGNGLSNGIVLGNPVQSTPIVNMKFNDNYIHDTRSEGWYLLRTQSDPQQEEDTVETFNNRICRSGLECDQIGQNGQGNYDHNNVLFMSAMNWGSPFDINQAFNNQRFYRKNGNKVEGSIYVGSGEQTLSLIFNKPTSVTLTSDTNYIRKCIVFNSRGAKDIFGGSQNVAIFNIVFDSCYLGYRPHTYLASKIYNGSSNNSVSLSYAILSQQNFSPNMTFAFRHMRYDTTGGKTRLDAGVSSSTYVDTAQVNTLVPLNFVNSGWSDNTTIANICMRWIDTIYNTFKDENPGVTGVNQNSPYTFNAGDIVEHVGRFYQSKVNGNQGHPPTGVSDSFWTLITWTKPDGTTSYLPPDDLRLPGYDFYAKQNIGLLDQLTNVIKIPAGSRIIAH